MSIDFTVYKGSPSGIVKSTSHRELGQNEVIVRITHAGVCGTDEHYVTSEMGLGHEGVGVVEKIAPGVTSVKVGDRVGFGWVHYYCGICEQCVSGTLPCDMILTGEGMDQYCVNRKQFGYHDRDEGSFGSHIVWDADALFILPTEMDSKYAGPLMCGGATVWGALSQYRVKPTDRVGVIGIGGLGHMAIQFASKMGCEVIAFSGTESKKAEALAFGAMEFVATKGLKDLNLLRKLNHLLITTSEQPDYDMYVAGTKLIC
jgi:D-arabinose 1-dehydrogenase-like Zn-dependent alcohol dehydrogenase